MGVDQKANALRRAIGRLNCLTSTAVALFSFTAPARSKGGVEESHPQTAAVCSYLYSPLEGEGGQQLPPPPPYSRDEMGEQPSVSAWSPIGRSAVSTKAAELMPDSLWKYFYYY